MMMNDDYKCFVQVSSINRVLRNISSELSGKAMPDVTGGGSGGVYDRFGLFAAAAWNRTNPWYAGSATGCGPAGGACPPASGAPRTDYHTHRTAVHHHSPIPAPPSATHVLVSKKGHKEFFFHLVLFSGKDIQWIFISFANYKIRQTGHPNMNQVK